MYIFMDAQKHFIYKQSLLEQDIKFKFLFQGLDVSKIYFTLISN